MRKFLLASAAAAFVTVTTPSWAFWNTTNTTEAYGILPNHTAFWIPGTGDTKDNQAVMENEDFFQEKKVPGKFFIIPHAKLQGSVYVGWDYYIPTGRLIVVDRTPYFHEWTMRGRGTDSATDQSFPCHSKDNIKVTAELSMAASVEERDAARFLYRFGVNPPQGNPADPNVIFTSVFEGKSLAQVMQGWGRGEFQSHVCREVMGHTIAELAQDGNAIIDQILKDSSAFFKNYGITVEFSGWAGGFSYPTEVESAINTRWAAEHIQPVLSILERKAVIDATSGWDHRLPTSLTILGPVNETGVLGALVGGLRGLSPNVAPVEKVK